MKPRKSDEERQKELERKRKGEVSTPTSIRLSPDERKIIGERAKEKDMKMTTYRFRACIDKQSEFGIAVHCQRVISFDKEQRVVIPKNCKHKAAAHRL